MLNINDNATMFVKGFSQEVDGDVLMNPVDCKGEFIAVITDLVTTGYVKVTAASKEDGKWVLTCSDGENRILEEEPDTPRKMEYGQLVVNFVRGIFGDTYNPVFPDHYEEAIEAIAGGDKGYRLVGYVNGRKVATGVLLKFWADADGRKHGITMSGSHYIF